MTARLGSLGVRLFGWIVFGFAFVWPLVSLVWHCLGDGALVGDATPSVRQWGLLGRCAALAGMATIGATALSLPAAMVLSEGGSRRRILSFALIAAVLLTPPMVFSFGWDRLLPIGIPGEVRCVLIWSLWAYPIPTFFLSAGWSRGGRRAYEAALLSCDPAQALLLGTWPVLRRYLLLSGLVLWILFFGDYGVPHACGLIVYATELLGWASNARYPIEAAAPAIPGVVIMALLLSWTAWLTRGFQTSEGDDQNPTRGSLAESLGGMLIILVVGWVVPIVGVALRMGSARAMVETARTYGADMGWSMLAAVAAGVMSIGLAWSAMDSVWSRRVMLGIALVLGALPGALVGTAVKASLNYQWGAKLNDHWPILSLCYTARFGWIALLVAAIVASSRRSELSAQAGVDGASWRNITDRLLLPLHARAFLAAAAVIATLSLAEVPASSLVRVPTFNPIAQVIIEKFHRFEDGVLSSLCLLLIAAAGACALVLFAAAENKVRRSADR